MPLSFPPDDIDAVIFDMGGVFFLPDHRRITAALATAGVAASADADVHHRAHYLHVGL